MLAFVLCSPILAQETTGNIVGTVKDPNGEAVPGATITIIDPNKNDLVVRTLTSSDDGTFSAPSLPVSVYQITVEAPNFKKSVQTDIKLDVGTRRTVDITLEAGNVAETVTVEADPVSVETTTPQSATVINGDQVRELSINNRNFVQLVTLAPGVSSDLDDLVFTGTNNPETQVVNRTLISVNGARSTQNTFTVDGADITDRGSNQTIQSYPSVESIREFKVLRSLYPAESGRSGGGQVNVVTRAGTDRFHGSAFEFVRNEAFNANDVGTNSNPSLRSTLGVDDNGKVKRRPFRYNNYGWTISGPIYFLGFGEGVPTFKRYEKTFFFFSQEFRRDTRYPTLNSIVPNAQMKQGVFSIPICLRATGTVCNDILPAGTPIGSRVPLSNVAQQYVNLIWNNVPNPTNAATLALDFPTLNVAKFRQEIFKLDHNFTKNWSAFYRFGNDKIPTIDADGSIGTRSGIPFVNQMESNSPGRTHSLQSTYVVTPNLIIEGRYSYGFGAIFTKTTGLIARDVSPIGVSLPYTVTRDVVPTLSILGFNSLTGFSNYDNFSWKKNYSGSTTWISGNHTMKFGAIYSLYRKNENALGGTNQGSFTTFNNSTSGSILATGVANTTVNQAIQRWANFLQGNNVTFAQSKFDLTADFRQKAFEAFAQDEWRVRRNLTLSYGARYSFFGSPIDKGGKLTNFVPSLWNPANAPQVTGAGNRVVGAGVNYCNGLIVNAQNYTTGPPQFNCTPTSSPWGEHVYDVSKKDFAPRIGLAWDPFGKGRTAIRTGYGIYHEQIPVGAIELFLGANPPYQENCNLSSTTLDNPVPSGSCTATAPSALVPNLRGIEPNFKTPYMQHWQLDWQQQLTNKTVVTIGYYGSKGTHLIGFTERNAIPPGRATSTQCATGANTLATPGAATVTCLPPGTGSFGAATTSNLILNQIRPFRGYQSINILETRYNSNYHSMQLSAQHRFSGASQVNLAYTWSKNLTDNQTSIANVAPQNTYDIRADYGRASLDRRHILSINYVYEIPFFNKQEGFIGKVLGGWQASGIISYSTGLPLTVTTSSYDPAGLGIVSALVAGGRPNAYCDPNKDAPHTVLQWFNTDCFEKNPLTTATNIINTPGNAGRGIVHGPSLRRVDFTLSKNIRFGENFRIQLRGEAFNVFNFTNVRGISTNVTVANFGQVVSYRDPRVLQFGARVSF